MAVVTPVRFRDWTLYYNFDWQIPTHEINSETKLMHNKQVDSLAERSKAPDSSSGGAIRVGSNPTAVIFLIFAMRFCAK